MPLIETKGAASAQGFGEFAQSSVVNYIEDCFSCFLYTGNGSTKTITNGIDLSTKGGLVWTKQRNGGAVAQDNGHALIDTVRGRGSLIQSNTTAAALAPPAGYQISSFGSSGYTLGADYWVAMNDNGSTFASWTFRKQPKFFDVVTYTGDGTTSRTVAHSLESTPGMVIIKSTSAAGSNWIVWHRGLTGTNPWLLLNTDYGTGALGNYGISLAPSSTTFTCGKKSTVAYTTNDSGATYVAYLFAHDAGGFGLTGTDNVISCGSYTGNGLADGPTITLGYEPQYLLVKNASSTGNWIITDNMRGFTNGSVDPDLSANTASAENAYLGGSAWVSPTATGFKLEDNGVTNNSGQTYIYIAIRRGPMKVPTDATKVFAPVAWSGTGSSTTVTGSGFAADAAMIMVRNGADDKKFAPRLTGQNHLTTDTTNAEITSDLASNPWDSMNGINVGSTGGANQSGKTYVYEFFKRAPSFFDEVCYTGTGSAQTINHNLGVAPELILEKCRNNLSSAQGWSVYAAPQGATKKGVLNSTAAFTSQTIWNNTAPTASVFSINGGDHPSGDTYVAYLFATLAGVSKVGSYTGNGSSQTINCGFIAGARFVMVKATSTTGNWIVADSARGIVSGNDPALYLNSTAAEVTTLDWIDADNSGFVVNETATIAANTNGVSYIYLAIA